MAKLERDIAAAFRQGKQAAISGQLSTTNPFDSRHELASERVQALMWMRGYSAGNPIPDPEDEGTASQEPPTK